MVNPKSAPTPYFGPSVPEAGRRLLLVSYHFPPGRAAGVLRWQKLARFAHEYGWGLDVLALHPRDLRAQDDTRLSDLPPDVRAFGVARRVGAGEHINRMLTRLARAVRGTRPHGRGDTPASTTASPRPSSLTVDAFGHPLGSLRRMERAFNSWLEYDADGRWARHAAAMAGRLFDPARHRIVVTCGPPQMAHYAGRLIRERTRLPHVMDMRDPWSVLHRLPEPEASRVWLWYARRHERACVDGAALVVTNTEPLRRAMATQYPVAAPRVITVMNGCDDEPQPPSTADGSFRIVFTGTIYIDRNPRVLFRAAARVVRELGLSPARFRVEFMGTVAEYSGVPITAIAREEGLDERYVSVRGSGARAEAFALMASAAILVSLPQDDHNAIPSKIFEYMQHEAWLLALAEPQSPVAQLLAGSAADVVPPNDLEAITSTLRRRFTEWRRGLRPHRLADDPRFSRRRQADVLFQWLERLS